MADPHWTSYVGMATGIIGALTGIKGYRKAIHTKSLDLRLELKKATHDAITNVHQIEGLINNANKSRQRVASARGMLNSGMMEKWKADVEKDKLKLANLLNIAPDPEENIEKCSERVLESKLVEFHKFQTAVNDLKEKYLSEYQKDDETRKQIWEENQRITNQILGT